MGQNEYPLSPPRMPSLPSLTSLASHAVSASSLPDTPVPAQGVGNGRKERGGKVR